MNFHEKYVRVNKWYEVSEFKLTTDHLIKVDIVGFDFMDEYGSIDIYGNLTVKAGFYFGASGPTCDTKSSREASCLHDLLYWFNQVGAFRRTYDGHRPDSMLIRKAADEVLLDTCLRNGMYEWRANMWHLGVRRFGDDSWRAEPSEQ